jgi:HAD superfamily hydrolase (TIGR01509 family)
MTDALMGGTDDGAMDRGADPVAGPAPQGTVGAPEPSGPLPSAVPPRLHLPVQGRLPKALIWDIDGTVAETERDGHLVAFNTAFAQLGLPWCWDEAEYAVLLHVTGGRERLLQGMRTRTDAPADPAAREALARELHRLKNAAYAERVAQGGIPPRPGVLRLMDACTAAGVRLAVATTTSTSNVEALFGAWFGAGWRSRFAAVVCAEDVQAKKPDPEAYTVALQRLGIAPQEAFALEDSPNGLAAARAAGIACGITRSVFFADAVFEGAAWVQSDLDTPHRVTLAHLGLR